jgi:hypothetical protein
MGDITCAAFGQLLNNIPPFKGTKTVDVKTAPIDLNITPNSLDFPNLGDLLNSLQNITVLIVKILSLMLLAQVIIRIFFINLYAILSPMGIAAWALPGGAGQPLTKLWFQGFLSTIMVQFLQVAALTITSLMLGGIAGYINGQLNTPAHSVLSAATLANIMRIAILWFILRIPNLLGTAPMRTIVEAGQAMQQAAGATIAVTVAEAQLLGSAVGSTIGTGLSIAAIAR